MYKVRNAFGVLASLLSLPFLIVLAQVFWKARATSTSGFNWGELLYMLWLVASMTVKMNMMSAFGLTGANTSRVLAGTALVFYGAYTAYLTWVWHAPANSVPPTTFQLVALALFFYGWPIIDFLELVWLARYAPGAPPDADT